MPRRTLLTVSPRSIRAGALAYHVMLAVVSEDGHSYERRPMDRVPAWRERAFAETQARMLSRHRSGTYAVWEVWPGGWRELAIFKQGRREMKL